MSGRRIIVVAVKNRTPRAILNMGVWHFVAVNVEPRNLSEWIVGGQDIYVIGFQECPSKKREDWIKGVLAQMYVC